MNLRVLYFAALRETLGRAGEELALPAGVATVAGLRAHLSARGEPWSSGLASAKLRFAVNQDLVDADAPVRAGDEVAFFPPVTGG